MILGHRHGGLDLTRQTLCLVFLILLFLRLLLLRIELRLVFARLRRALVLLLVARRATARACRGLRR